MANWTPEKQAARKARRQQRALGKLPPTKTQRFIEPEFRGSKGGRMLRVEFKKPEATALALDFIGAPEGFDPKQFEAFCVQSGLPKPVTDGLLKRLRLRFNPVVEKTLKYTTKHFQDQIDEKIGMALHHLDDTVLSAASAKDLAVTIGILIEKRALLRGEPTAILSTEERTNLNVLVTHVMKEAQRRGITVDQTGEEVRSIGGGIHRLLNVPAEILPR